MNDNITDDINGPSNQIIYKSITFKGTWPETNANKSHP